MTSTTTTATEQQDLIATLDVHRSFLRTTVRGLTDEQALQRTTVSELCLAAIIKHVARQEETWVSFILQGPEVMVFDPADPQVAQRWAEEFQVGPDETLEQLLEHYEEVARRTSEVVATVDLNATQPLPDAPWFPPGAHWSARTVLLHILAETAQHAGHADIIRESLDGTRTMG